MKSFLVGLLFVLPVISIAAPVDVPMGIDHALFDRLLKKYVNANGQVDYAAWAVSTNDVQALYDYTRKFYAAPPFAKRNERAASLLNAYNAFAIRWILEMYPVKSIKDTKNPFRAMRLPIGDRKVSLDEIENETLRVLVGYRVHAALVNASKSSPPLRSEAYTADKLREELDEQMRAWLAREDLNRFQPDKNRVELSKLFDWYGKDFAKAEGGLPGVLVKYAPAQYAEFLKGQFAIDFLKYDWELNAASPVTASR